MSFASLDLREIGQLFDANLRTARAALGLDVEELPILDNQAALRRAMRAAEQLTKRQVGPAAWRMYRDDCNRLGAPQYHPQTGAVVRRGKNVSRALKPHPGEFRQLRGSSPT